MKRYLLLDLLYRAGHAIDTGGSEVKLHAVDVRNGRRNLSIVNLDIEMHDSVLLERGVQGVFRLCVSQRCEIIGLEQHRLRHVGRRFPSP